MSDVALLYATFPDRGEAERIVRITLAERLAACVNILPPCRSIYRWQSAVESADEVAAVAGEARTLLQEIRRRDARSDGRKRWSTR